MPDDCPSSASRLAYRSIKSLPARIDEDIAILHLAGLSNRVMAMVSKWLLGVEVPTDTATKSLDLIEGKALSWLERLLDKKYWALFIEGTDSKIQYRGSTEREPSLVVLDVNDENHISIFSILISYAQYERKQTSERSKI